MSANQADKQLVKRMLNGDQRAFDQFFDLYYPRIYRFCHNRVPENDVDEVTLDSLKQAMHRIETYRGDASLISWIYQVARSRVSAYFKSRERHQVVDLIDDHPEVLAQIDALSVEARLTPSGALEREQHVLLIQSMLDHLPSDYGKVLELKYVEGASVEEIAEQQATTVLAVQSMLARARKAFRETYQAVAEFSPVANAETIAVESDTQGKPK